MTDYLGMARTQVRKERDHFFITLFASVYNAAVEHTNAQAAAESASDAVMNHLRWLEESQVRSEDEPSF